MKAHFTATSLQKLYDDFGLKNAELAAV